MPVISATLPAKLAQGAAMLFVYPLANLPRNREIVHDIYPNMAGKQDRSASPREDFNPLYDA